jgi:hypothetical protein
MKKKKVKDEDGYLGRHMCAHFYSHADHIQSPRKKLYGSLSRRTNLNPRGLSLRPPGRQAVRRESRLVRKDKAVLPVSSRKLDTSKARCCVHTLNTHLALKLLQVSIFPPSIAPRPHVVHISRAKDPVAGVYLWSCGRIPKRNAAQSPQATLVSQSVHINVRQLARKTPHITGDV